jgi:hypothetical protein
MESARTRWHRNTLLLLKWSNQCKKLFNVWTRVCCSRVYSLVCNWPIISLWKCYFSGTFPRHVTVPQWCQYHVRYTRHKISLATTALAERSIHPNFRQHPFGRLCRTRQVQEYGDGRSHPQRLAADTQWPQCQDARSADHSQNYTFIWW